jgi:magnesium transporter
VALGISLSLRIRPSLRISPSLGSTLRCASLLASAERGGSVAGMTIRAWELTPERGTPISPELAAERLSDESIPVWIDIPVDELASFEQLRGKLPGHPLAWEDAAKPEQRPKFEDHGDHFFLIVRSLDTSHDWLGMQLETLQMACFLSDQLLITIRGGKVHGVDDVAARLEKGLVRPHARPDGVLYALLDSMFDAYIPHVDRWEDEVERLDQQALEQPQAQVLGRVLAIRKHVVRLRLLSATQAEILSELCRAREHLVHSQTRPYFKDIYDHLVSVREATDQLRDSVAIAVDIYLNSVNNRLNHTMKVFTMMSALMLPFTIVTGIYGMNFSIMPGANIPDAFWWTIGGMVGVASSLFFTFRYLKLL